MAKAKSKDREFPFTLSRLEKLPAPTRGRVRYRDQKCPGLALVVTAAGSKTFYFYRWRDNRPVEERIGPFPDVTIKAARDACGALVNKQAQGVDLAAERRSRREAPTLQDLFDHWLAHAKLRKKTWPDDQRMFDKYVSDLAGWRLDRITKAVIQERHDKIGEDNGPYMANRVRALLCAMFNQAEDIGFTGANPVAKVRKFREKSRERFLLPNEVSAFFKALHAEDPQWRDYFLMLLFTGARRGNVASMEWTEVDLDRGVWHLPGRKVKTGEPQAVVLPAPAVELLERRLPHTETTGYVFPGPGATGHVVDPRKAWERIREASGLADLRMHDLRRTLGSWQAAGGASLQVVGASLGHRDPKATAVYSRLQLDPVRASVEAAVAALQVAGKPKQIEGDT